MVGKFKVKSKIIAEELGVSPATVSLALNNKPGVNAETRHTILKLVEQYKSGGKSLYGLTIMLLVYNNKDKPYWPENSTLFNYSYIEFLRLAQQEHMEVKPQYVSSLEELQETLAGAANTVSGIAFNADECPEEGLALLDSCPVPLVVYASKLSGTNWDVVNFHNEKAVREGLDYLFAAGHKDIVYLMNIFEIYNFAARRVEYERYMLEKSSLGCVPKFVITGNVVETATKKIVNYLKDCSKLPDALFSENYMVSIALSRATQQMNLSTPQDIAVIGIDTIPETVSTAYVMDCFSVPHAARMQEVCGLLFAKIRKKSNVLCSKEILLSMVYRPGNSVLQKSKI